MKVSNEAVERTERVLRDWFEIAIEMDDDQWRLAAEDAISAMTEEKGKSE